MYINQKQINPPKKYTKLKPRMFSLLESTKYIDNSVNFPDNSHPPQDYSENYPFFQQNKNKQQTPYDTNYLSSDDDDYYQPNIFAPYTKDYRIQRHRQSQPSQNIKIYPQRPTDMQNQQPMHIQNPFDTQSFQPIQPKTQ